MIKTGEYVLVSGDEACACGAISAGCRFFAGYPITPATEIAETFAEELPKVGGTFIQMEDELASACAIVGASLAGAKSMTATSGPGFSLMQEAIGYAAMTETPCVFVNVMRGGPSTGMPTKVSQGDIMQARWGTHGDHPVIALYPNSVKETYTLIVRAFFLAERFRVPVIFLMDESLGHLRESIEVPPIPQEWVLQRMADNLDEEEIYHPYEEVSGFITPLRMMGKSRFHVSGLVHDETGFPLGTSDVADKLAKRLDKKIQFHLDEIMNYEEYMVEDAEILLIAYGSTSRSARQAVRMARMDGIKVGLFRPITIWPFPNARLKKLISRVDAALVAELNMGQIYKEVSQLNKKGKLLNLINRVDGELISPDQIIQAINELRIQLDEY
ncbi:MAG TPA: 2-oxoacid:acceptor oxidoreductase subunit alpha [Thermotogota bacterium]|nr:2-oxoacid:acceptor oxidoreductase subunit alpha [Thermotogaceae bacterium]HNR63585.1 2-oxoacid:acceptor oxidoreductase subunit alpha [Thermotogota bacterium]HNT95708.1 2-oxoacid:acceptor oxidoreductase subunit alpha [Thermotogota bacterium]HOZ11620.1 2-oxoacid:acceptor oxidoreductase subunit alpha [Thermotogota bacterium]HPX96641.1 2-oxoacid:acceptor oxidoreductase subunit alpha [Thermotogota bacterium]